jgi:hypothetical protein
MGHAAWLLERRARTKIETLEVGLWTANPSPAEWSGWAGIDAGLAPGEFKSLRDPATGERIPLRRERGQYRFWVEKLGPHALRRWELEAAEAPAPAAGAAPVIRTDAQGWPVEARWAAMKKPLWEGALGEFQAIETIAPADRRTIHQLHANPDARARAEIRARSVKLTEASHAEAKRDETPHTLIFTQAIRHSRLERAERRVEIWKREPRARVSVKFDRIASHAPEVLYLVFDLPQGCPLPLFAGGGVPFTPYTDQLRGSCRDYYVIDGWARYSLPEGDWLWVTRDASLVAVGGPHALERRETAPDNPRRIAAMIFDNCWHTNFVADSHGTMEFQFELAWREKIAAPAGLAETLAAEAVVMPRRGEATAPELMKTLYKP